MGTAWGALGDIRKAVSFFERALEILAQLYQASHPAIALVLSNLGTAWIALGDAPKAASFFGCALQILQQAYQTPHSAIALALNNLGSVWIVLDDTRQAVSFYERALAIYEQVYQAVPNHPDIAGALNNLGLAWDDLGEADKAVSFYERALAIYEQVYQETTDHPDIAGTLNNLGMAWRDLGNAPKAVSYYGEALAIYEQVYQETPNHPKIVEILKALRRTCSLNKNLYDSEGTPLIYWMAQNSMVSMLVEVLALGWSPNLANPNAGLAYPLHYSAMMNNVGVTRLLLQAGAHPFVQTGSESTPAMAAIACGKPQTLALLLPAQAGLSFENLATFKASYEAYKASFTPSAARKDELLVALQLALQLGDAALLQAIVGAIGRDTAEAYLLVWVAEQYPLVATGSIRMRFRGLCPSGAVSKS